MRDLGEWVNCQQWADESRRTALSLFSEMSVMWAAPSSARVGEHDGLWASPALKFLWTFRNSIGPLFKVYWFPQDTGGA